MSVKVDKLADLTRWNRAGLSRFAYVDGDAAVWLEELRIAMLGLVARGAPLDQRVTQAWRDIFMCDEDQWPSAAERAMFSQAVVWKTLEQGFPDRPETAVKRNLRLIGQYRDKRNEYGWEIMRAFARASHVLLGHLNAYTNEGYLRTATQWDNLRKLAAMVNHQPAPPTSAITTVGLILEDLGEVVEIERGLAMNYTPPEGGAPVVFETLSAIEAHPLLNGARASQWNFNPTQLAFGAATDWIAPEGLVIAPGALAVLSSADGSGTLAAAALADVQHDIEAERAQLTFNPVPAARITGDTVLHVEPRDVRRGAPRTTTDTLVVRIATSSNYPIGSIIRLHFDSSSKELEVVGNAGGHLKLRRKDATEISGEVIVETLAPFGGIGLTIFTSPEILDLYFLTTTGDAIKKVSGVAEEAVDEDGDKIPGTVIANKFVDNSVFGAGYAPVAGAKRESGLVIGDPPEVVPNSGRLPKRTISFAGKPPKKLAIGDFMVMRGISDGVLTGLRVVGLLSGAETYHLQFHADLTSTPQEFEPDAREFHGPMAGSLRPVGWDRNPGAAISGGVVFLEGLSPVAKELLRTGRVCLIEDERGTAAEGGADPAQVNILETVEEPAGYKVVFDTAFGLDAFTKGWTLFRLNAVAAGHGETKSPKVLGSGDGERARQKFDFATKRISFVPSSVAETGVAPDMDVLVDGVGWTYRDLVDPTADETESWSSALNDDDSLTIYFRRRLPTGTNNLAVARYRTGVGAGGAVPARVFAKPMKKNRHVAAISQPFTATGGADREPVADIRINAPARLAANDRAVSVADFERLCRRRSDVWQARARLLSDPAISEGVGIVLVLANGTQLANNQTLAGELVAFVEARAIPGTRVLLEDFDLVPIRIDATIRVETERYDKTETQKAAHAALVTTFSLKNRALGQTAYIAEAIAALEGVEGVSSATMQTFALRDADTILRTAMISGAVTALVPFDNQVIAAETGQTSADFTVAVEAIT